MAPGVKGPCRSTAVVSLAIAQSGRNDTEASPVAGRLPAPEGEGGAVPPWSPVRTLVVLSVAMAIAEFVTEIVFRKMMPQDPYLAAANDVVIVVALVFPAMWWFVFLPLRRALAERRRTERALRRRTAEMEALSSVSQAATRHLDPDLLLGEVVGALLPVFNADGGWVIARGDTPSDSPRAIGGRGVPPALLEPGIVQRQAFCPSCRGAGLCAKPPMTTPEVYECQSVPDFALRSAGFRQHLGVVLPVGGRAGVILNLVWREERSIDEAQVALVKSIGAQVCVAVENAFLFHSEQRARAEAETLQSAGLAVARSLDLDETFGALFEHLGRLVPFDRAKVMLREGESRLKVHAYFSQKGRPDFPERPLGAFDIHDNAALRQILQTGLSLLVPDTRARADWAPGFPAGAERSWLGVPLRAGGRVIGLYTLVRREPDGFTAEQARLAEALAAPTSAAVSNTLLYQETADQRERLRTLSSSLVQMQETERKGIARELHDEAGQCLSSLRLGLRLLESEAADTVAVLRRAGELRDVVDRVQADLHRLASDLRPAAIDHVGLEGALRQLASSFAGSGPEVEVETTGLSASRLDPLVEVGLYRIAQEALTNAVRHAEARHLSLVVSRRAGRVVMVVEDDGRGMDLDAAGASGRLGLVGIRERTEMMGGTLALESSAGAGTTLVVEVPNAA